MYIPPHFANRDVSQLHDAIETYSFALIVNRAGDDLVASHLPLLLDRSSGPQGTLLGHFARANAHWRSAAGQQALVVFSGPHAYISPTWYAAEHVVPTWNYISIHAYGRVELIEDPVGVLALLDRTVEHFESNQPRPWRLADQPAEFIERLAGQIVGFRIPIDRLEGKWKLNQNHPQERRERVIAALSGQESADSLAVARLMQD
jgi:transcriptional regulator